MSKRSRFIALVIPLALGLLLLSVCGRWTADSPSDLYREGLAALQESRFSDVRERIRKLRKSPGGQADATLLSARYHIAIGQPDLAIRELLAAEFAGSQKLNALLLLGESFYQKNEWAAAQTFFEQAARAEPENPEAHRWLGAVYYDIGAMGLAKWHLEKLAELRPEDPAPHRLLGLIFRDSEDHKSAIKHYRMALERKLNDQSRLEVTYELAQSLMAQLDFMGAMDVLKLVPDQPGTLVLRARCQLGIGDIEAASQLLAVAEPKCNDEPEFFLTRARVALESRQWDRAVRDAERARELDPRNREVLHTLANAYQGIGDVENTRKISQQSLETLQLRSRLAELSRQADLHPRDEKVRDELSEICEQLGKVELAKMWKRAANACRDANLAADSIR